MDKNVNRTRGGGSIYVTPGIVFQEEVLGSETRSSNTNHERSKRRSLKLNRPSNTVVARIDPQKNPDRFLHCGYLVTANTKDIDTLLTLWKLLTSESPEKGWSRFMGFVIKLYQTERNQTIMTYLPPIQTPITVSLFETSRKLAKNANMMCTPIIMDASAAIKAYHVVWNGADYWNDIIIHLGDFQAIMTFFNIIGTFISGRGFDYVRLVL